MWKPSPDLLRAFKRYAVFQRKKKARQGCVGPGRQPVDEVYAVLSGDFEFFSGKKWLPAPPRTIGFFPREKVYGIRANKKHSGPVEVISILMLLDPANPLRLPSGPLRLPALWWRRFLELESRCDFEEWGHRVLPRQELEQFLHQLGTALAPQQGAGRMIEQAGQSAPRRSDTVGDWVETWAKAEDVIRTRSGEGLTVDELAAAVNVSSTQLRRVFHLARGTTPKKALSEWRVNEARRLLKTGNFNVTQIAEMVGFSTVQHFSYVYKSFTGAPPSGAQRSPAQKKSARTGR
jgi:AraC-like DNA-binding protein